MIDSNIWAYFFDSTLPEHEKVKETLENAIKNKEILMTTVIQMEIMHYMIKRLGAIIGREKLEIFLNYPFALDVLDRELVVDTMEVLQKYSHMGIGARDASILASMKRNDVNEIMTHDQALKKIEGIKAFDPVEG